MPILAAAREPAPDDEGEATPSTARGLKALAADRRVAFPKSQALAHLPLIPPAPPEADDFRSASKRSNSKPLPSDAIEDSPSSVHSGRSRDQSKTLDWRRRTTSKGKVQVLAVPEVAVPLQDDDIPGLPGVRESHVREAFNQIDFDGNGFIGVSELRYLLTVLGEEPTDAELDEMLAMIGGEGDGQAALEDFRMLFAPKSSVLAEMQTMAPEPEEEEIKQEKEDEQEEIPRLEAPPQQLGLLVKGAASFMQARIKKAVYAPWALARRRWEEESFKSTAKGQSSWVQPSSSNSWTSKACSPDSAWYAKHADSWRGHRWDGSRRLQRQRAATTRSRAHVWNATITSRLFGWHREDVPTAAGNVWPWDWTAWCCPWHATHTTRTKSSSWTTRSQTACGRPSDAAKYKKLHCQSTSKASYFP